MTDHVHPTHRGIVVEAAPIVAWRWVPAEGALTWSEGAAEIVGLRPEQGSRLSHPVREFIHPDDRPVVAEAAAAVREGRDLPTIECRSLRADGSEGWVRIEGKTATDEAGKLVARGIVRDITERKKAEQALQESEEKWHSLVENAQDVIFLVDRDLNIQYVNRSVPGSERAKIIGTSVFDYISPVSQEDARRAFGRVFETGEVEAHWHRGAGPSGENSSYSVRLGPVKVAGKTVAVSVICTDITERKRAEDALRESEEKWRSVLENAHDFVGLVTPDLKVIFLNRTVPGLEMEDVVGKDGLDFIAPEHHDAAREAVERVIRTGAPESFETKGTGPDGRAAWYWCRLGPVRVGGRVVSAACVSTDITERKEAEAALWRSEHRFNQIAAHIKDVLWLGGAGENRGIYYLSPAFEEISGRRAQDVYEDEQVLWDCLHEDDREAFARVWREYVRTGTGFDAEFRVVRPDGTMRWVRARGFAVKNAQGTHNRTAGVMTDITERRRTEEALRESEERYRTVCEKSVDGISLMVDGRIEYVNARLCEMLGYAADELKARPALEFVSLADRGTVGERLQALLQGGTEKTSRYEFLKKDGSAVVLEGSGRMIQLRGKPALLHVVREATDREPPGGSEDLLAALTDARTALEEVAPQLQRDSTADFAASRALARIYKILPPRARRPSPEETAFQD